MTDHDLLTLIKAAKAASDLQLGGQVLRLLDQAISLERQRQAQRLAVVAAAAACAALFLLGLTVAPA